MLATVPSALAMLLDAVRGPLPDRCRPSCASVRGFPPTVVRLRATGSSAVLHNLYGPTEAAVSATGYEVRDDHEYDRVPIGTAQPSVVARVLDARLRPSWTASLVSCISEVSSWPAAIGAMPPGRRSPSWPTRRRIAYVPHRRDLVRRMRRQHQLSRAHRSPAQDPRVPDRARRDRGRAAAMRLSRRRRGHHRVGQG